MYKRQASSDPDSLLTTNGDEVRRYSSLQQMVAELGADLLPDTPSDSSARMRVYEDLYGADRCARGFLAMRVEWPSIGEFPSASLLQEAKKRRVTKPSRERFLSSPATTAQ